VVAERTRDIEHLTLDQKVDFRFAAFDHSTTPELQPKSYRFRRCGGRTVQRRRLLSRVHQAGTDKPGKAYKYGTLSRHAGGALQRSRIAPPSPACRSRWWIRSAMRSASS